MFMVEHLVLPYLHAKKSKKIQFCWMLGLTFLRNYLFQFFIRISVHNHILNKVFVKNNPQFCVRILKWQKGLLKLRMSVFKFIIFWNYQLEFVNEGFNRQILFWRGQFNSKLNVLVPCIGLLLVKKLQNVLLILTKLVYQIHIFETLLRSHSLSRS